LEIKFATKLPGQQARGIIPASYDKRIYRLSISISILVSVQMEYT